VQERCGWRMVHCEAEDTWGAAMFAGQQPYPTWPQALPPPDDPGPGARRTESVEAKSNGVASGAGRSPTLVIVLGAVLGLVVLSSAGFVGTVILRPAPAPKAAAALPPLASDAPPLAEDASNSLNQPIESGPLSGSEPTPLNSAVSQQASLEAVPPPASITTPAPWNVPQPPAREAAKDDAAPLPPPRPLEFRPIPIPIAPPATGYGRTGYDRWTAVYDISAHSVYLPDGTRLEAHSGLGDRLDDPRYVDERDRGATPPDLYELTLRESLFHGVQALRLTPIGAGDAFGRSGLLAHPYMLGPSGDSNGCVSFKDYDAFLRAYQNGEVKRLMVVARSTQEPRQYSSLESLRRDLDR
jgi:hypothetical protein